MRRRLNDALHEAKRHLRLLAKQAARPLRGGPEGAVAIESTLRAKIIRKDGSVEDRGIVSTKMVTTAFVNFLVDQMQASSGGIAGFKFHASGTSNTAESVSDTALVAEVQSRASGSQAEGSAANIYRSAGTVSYTASNVIVEHGLFSAASGGTLADRSVFDAISVGNGESITFTYDLTFPAGG